MGILGIVGPSGVGKSYLLRQIRRVLEVRGISYHIPRVVTTRERRSSDGSERVCISLDEFMDLYHQGHLFGVHQPFGTHWYGFYVDDFRDSESIILTEVHVDNVALFKRQFSQVYLIGLTASNAYLSHNLFLRHGTLSPAQIARLERARYEKRKMILDFVKGKIDILALITKKNLPLLSFASLWLVPRQRLIDWVKRRVIDDLFSAGEGKYAER